MPVKKKTNKAPGQGMTAKQMKRRKPISQEYMLPIEPLTENQKVSLMHGMKVRWSMLMV